MKHAFKIIDLLLPFGWLYGLITGVRNRLFDSGMLKSVKFNIPVISIGNITVGGTGKTPHTEYIASLLKDSMKTAVLSRGYGRRTKGFILAGSGSNSSIIGDEPLQIKNRFPDLDVAVCEDRVYGIRRLMDSCSPQVVILDDAFQHRRVTPSLNILLVNWHRDIMSDTMLPAGRLRESAKGRRRAQIIIVTKCPDDINQDSMDRIDARLRTGESQQIYFSTLEYGDTYPIGMPDNVTAIPSSKVLAVTGIASPGLLEAHLKSQGCQVTLMIYPDHHNFRERDIRNIAAKLQSMGDDTSIITTAKDAARLIGMEIDGNLRKRIFVLPVGIRFLRDAEKFESAIREHVESFRKQQETT